jgi:cell division transport system ATP-binding protein
MSDATIIRFQEVTKSIKGRTILNRVSFTLHKSEFYYLVGKTGSGKSTLLRLIYADLFPDEGSIQVGPFRIETLKRSQIPLLRRQLGIIFQDFQLLPEKTILENLYFAMEATGWRNRKQMRNKAINLLVQVGLSHKQNQYPHQLSGGEQQRAAIARALVNEPIVLLADEPTGNLDPEAADHIMQILSEIHKLGTAILMATHDYHLIHDYPQPIFHLENGTLTSKTAETFLQELSLLHSKP